MVCFRIILGFMFNSYKLEKWKTPNFSVPANKRLLTGTVPANKRLLAGTVPANNLFLIFETLNKFQNASHSLY